MHLRRLAPPLLWCAGKEMRVLKCIEQCSITIVVVVLRRMSLALSMRYEAGGRSSPMSDVQSTVRLLVFGVYCCVMQAED